MLNFEIKCLKTLPLLLEYMDRDILVGGNWHSNKSEKRVLILTSFSCLDMH